MDKSVLDNLTIKVMIEHIARGHAFNKHILGEDKSLSMNGLNALRASYDKKGRRLGADLKINTVLDLKHYIETLIDKEDTTGFVNPRDGSITLYQQSDNVMMHFNQNDRQHDYGSIYRYYNSRSDFYNKMARASSIPEEDVRHEFVILDNSREVGSVRNALEKMIIGIKHEPDKYTAKPDTQLVSARFIAALENDYRPGRKDIEKAPNNWALHSSEYADIHERNMMGPLSLNSSKVMSLLAMCSVEAVECLDYPRYLLDIGDNIDEGEYDYITDEGLEFS